MSFLHIPVVLNTLTLLNVAFVLLAVAGNEFIRRRNARGWQLWIPANILAVLYFALLHEWWTLALFVYYFVTSIMGFVHWRRAEHLAKAQHFLFVRDERFDFFSSPAMRAAMRRLMARPAAPTTLTRPQSTQTANRSNSLLRAEPRMLASTESLAPPVVIEREAIRIRESVRIVPEPGAALRLEPDFGLFGRRD